MEKSTIYVNPASGKDTGAGSSSAPFKTLTKALQKAVAGTTIQLAAGTYNAAGGEVFPLLIPAGVMVLGDEPSKGKGILIVGSGQYVSPTFASQNVTLHVESNAQLRGITVTNPVKLGTAVWIESTAPLIANNTFTGCGREGVFVTGTAKPLIFDNVFIANASSGVFLVRNAKGEVRRNVCQKTGYGIAISDSAAPLISDNKLLENSTGIFLSRGARPVLRRNLIEKNTSGGLLVTGEARPDLGSTQDPAGNILRNNGSADLQNSTSLTLVSVGNQLNPTQIQGPVVLRSAQVPAPMLGPAQFSDLGSHWAAAAISQAAGMGFVSGFPDGTFRPLQNLTRVQALVSLVSGLGMTGGNPNLLLSYSDRAQIPSYATVAVSTATQRRLVVNYPKTNQLEPMRSITRAEVAALIYQALVATGRPDAIASPYIVSPDPSFTLSFFDIQQHWATNFIRPLGSLNLVTGFADGSFKPDEPLNRSQYAAMVVKIFNPTPVRPEAQFLDIPADFWALTAISQAYRGGFLSGFPDQTFHPQQNMRRIDLITSLAHGLALSSADVKVLEIYEDRDTIPAYAKSAVAAATQAGIIVNYPKLSLLQPTQEATRAEAIAFIYQALVRTGRVSAVNSPYIVSALPS